MVTVMAKNRARQNDKNLSSSKAEYSYSADSFGGVDLTTPDGKCADSRFPFLVNMYRDKEKQNGAAIETFPGYRLLPKCFSEAEGRIYGLFSHSFLVDGEEVACLLVHRGPWLYLLLHEARDKEETLAPLIALAESPSQGFSANGCFYLLDGERIVRVSSPTLAEEMGDEVYTDEMAEEGRLPETNVYIPTAFLNGEAYETRNLLTDYYDVVRTLDEETVFDSDHGLKLRLAVVDGERMLEVYGFEKGRREIFVPTSADYNGETLAIGRIAAGAFTGSAIRRVILSPSVRYIEGDEGFGNGAFYGCEALESAILYGVETVSADAFALCYSLKEVVFGKSVRSIAPTAFYGDSALHSVYFEGESAAALGYVFGEDVTVFTDCFLAFCEKGDVVRVVCDPELYPKTYTLYGGEYDAITSLEAYEGVWDEESELNVGYAFCAKRAVPVVSVYLRGVTSATASRYLFVTVTEGGNLPIDGAVKSLTVPLPDLCRAISSVTLDGETLSENESETAAYYSFNTVRVDGISYCASVRVTLPADGSMGRRIAVRCYGKSGAYASRSIADYTSATPRYEGTSLDVIRRCRFASVFSDRVFLGGNPDLPHLLFYSVAPRDSHAGEAYFGATAFVAFPQHKGKITSLLSHPDYLAVLKERASYAGSVDQLVKSDGEALGHPLFAVKGGCGAPASLGKTLFFRDDPVYLSREGLYGISSGDAYEQRRIEKRSYFVDGTLLSEKSLASASLVEWKGYLALLVDGRIYLADGDTSVTVNGERQYEWYLLDGIGHYKNEVTVYHHASAYPIRDGVSFADLAVDGKPLSILEDERLCEGEVLSAEVLPEGEPFGVTVFYTVMHDEEGRERYYLLDSRGEKTGGVFYPAVSLLSLGGVLYFGTSDGCLLAFNTDKRGMPLVKDGVEFPVEKDEIHPYWYSFNGRAYRAAFATSFADMGVPHIAKTTVRKSLAIKAKVMPHASFSLAVRTDRTPFHRIGRVVASGAFCDEDFAAKSFVTTERVITLLAEHERGWVEKQLLFEATVFRAPYGIDSFAYRYTLSGRPKKEPKRGFHI